MLLKYFVAVVVLIHAHAVEGRSVSLFERWIHAIQCHRGRCAHGWTCSPTSCYHYTNEKVIFTEALRKCREFHAELVEVNDEKEQQFLTNQGNNKHLPDDFWIALTDTFQEGNYVWINTWNKMTFSKWAPGQPDNAGHDEDCIHMCIGHEFQWNDLPCVEKRQFVCER